MNRENEWLCVFMLGLRTENLTLITRVSRCFEAACTNFTINSNQTEVPDYKFRVCCLIEYLLFADKHKNYNFAVRLKQSQWPSVLGLHYDKRRTVIIMSRKEFQLAKEVDLC